MKKLRHVKELILELGYFGGPGAGLLIAFPLTVLTSLLYGVLTLNLAVFSISILGIFSFLLLLAPLLRLLHAKRKKNRLAYLGFLKEIRSHKPYENLYRFEPPRQYELVAEKEYLPKIKSQILMGINVKVKHIKSTNNVVIKAWFIGVEPQWGGLGYIS